MQEPLSRLSELQRRVQSDPAPFVFAQLAEEYCRAGRFADAVACCRSGLERHPGYLSARLILGRALVALSKWDDAAAEYAKVVAVAPDNLAATRELAEIHDHQGRVDDALHFYRRALALARNDKGLEAAIAALSTAAALQDLASDPSPPNPPAASPSTQVDFDAVLASLGHPDQQPPPVIELLLTDPTALMPGDAAAVPTTPTAADDALGQLERDLRQRVDPVPMDLQAGEPAEADSTAASVAARIDAAVVADLEAWLAVLARDRSGSSQP